MWIVFVLLLQQQMKGTTGVTQLIFGVKTKTVKLQLELISN